MILNQLLPILITYNKTILTIVANIILYKSDIFKNNVQLQYRLPYQYAVISNNQVVITSKRFQKYFSTLL